MSAMREEPYQLADQLPGVELRPASEVIRGRVAEHGERMWDLPFFASFEAESDLWQSSIALGEVPAFDG